MKGSFVAVMLLLARAREIQLELPPLVLRAAA